MPFTAPDNVLFDWRSPGYGIIVFDDRHVQSEFGLKLLKNSVPKSTSLALGELSPVGCVVVPLHAGPGVPVADAGSMPKP
jgi:hypothetical protein